jgi:hypothetical protein
MSEQGYNHQLVGQKVAQIQAVLARRCAAIGELQQHLLRAGWQQGVSQWGVLGHGGDWAAVAGFCGSGMAVDDTSSLSWRESGDKMKWDPQTRRLSSQIGDVQYDPTTHLPSERSSQAKCFEKQNKSAYKAKVFVQKYHGGGVYVADPGFLAEWSVEAMLLIRKHLYRAGNGMILLPYQSNWLTKSGHDEEGAAGALISEPAPSKLPLWATVKFGTTDDGSSTESLQTLVTISNLPLLAAEVEELLDVMGDIMAIQRQRRLDRLRPSGRFRRNWYVVATCVPAAVTLLHWMVRHGELRRLLRPLYHSASSFFKYRLKDPVLAM